MPIYEYRCAQCGIFEEVQRITDQPLERCPKCRRKVQRLISSTSFHLKGSGWYATDYARAGSGSWYATDYARAGSGNGREKKKDAPEAAGSSGGSDSGAESKGTTTTDSGGTPAKTSS